MIRPDSAVGWRFGDLQKKLVGRGESSHTPGALQGAFELGHALLRLRKHLALHVLSSIQGLEDASLSAGSARARELPERVLDHGIAR